MSLLEELGKISLNPAAPAGERWDANKEAFTTLQSEISGLDFQEIREDLSHMLANPQMMGKATRLEPYSIPYKRVDTKTKGGHVSILHVNEFGVVLGGSGQSRYVEMPTAGGFPFLRHIINNVDIIKAVILTRQRQIENFCQRESDQSQFGIQYINKDGSRIEDGQRKNVDVLHDWITNCGDESDPTKRKKLRRDNMRGFVKKFVFDSLGADACPVEIQRTNNGKISGIYNVPFDTIRLCTEEGYEGDDQIFSVQLIDDVPHVVYGYEDMVYEIRNPRTDLVVNGYGFAETEMSVRAVTAYLNSVTYNAAGLDRNSVPRGILQLFGDYHPRELSSFRNQFQAMLHGASNRWKLPVLAARNKDAGASYIPIDQNYDEMYFARWITFLVSIVCALFSIDPSEIHFDSFNAKNSSSLSGDDTAEKLAHSRDKGLAPLITFVQDFYNTWIIPSLDDTLRIRLVGLRSEDEAQKWERMKLTSDVNEMRAMDGRDPADIDIVGNAPTNPALMQAYMMEQQMKAQKEMGQAGGERGPNDYPTDEDGEHDPYQENDGEEPEDDHMHTLNMGVQRPKPGQQPGADNNNEQRMGKSFRVEVE